MADFSHLKKLDVTGESEAEFVLDEIWGEPSIWLKPMAETNIEYMNERVRLAVERSEREEKIPRKKKRERILSTDRLEEDREMDRVLISRTCATRWGTAPKDKDGKEVEFSEENCYDFLRAIPSYMFDPMRSYVGNVYNFVDKAAVAPDWAEHLGNDTPSD